MRPECLTRWYASRSVVEAGARNEAFASGKSVRLRWPCPAHLFIWWKEAAFGDFCPRARSSPRLRESSPWHRGQRARSLPLHEPESVNSLSCTGNRWGRLQWNFTSRSSLLFAQVEVRMQSKYAISICNLWRNGSVRKINLIASAKWI